MSSGCRRYLPCIWLLSTAQIAQAQDGAEANAMIEAQRAELREGLAEPSCAVDEFQPDTIVVCGETEDDAEQTRAVMSVLPPPIQSDRNLLGGLRDQPCWIAPRGGVCIRGGWAPPPVVLIDLDAIPEALTPEEEALVFTVEDAPPPETAP